MHKLSELSPGDVFTSVNTGRKFLVTDAKSSWIGVTSGTWCVCLADGELTQIRDDKEVVKDAQS